MPYDNATGSVPSAGELVAHYIFRRDDQIVINGVAYVCENTTREGHTLVRVQDSLAETFSHAEIQRLIESEELEVRSGHYHPGCAEVAQRTGGKRFQDLSFDQQDKVRFRKEICDRFLERERQEHWISRSENKLRIVIRQIMAERDASNRDRRTHQRCDEHSLGSQDPEPSPKTLRRWLRRYERADYDKMALVNNYKAPAHTSQLSPEAYEIHTHFARQYASRKKPTKAQVYDNLCRHIDDLNEKRSEDETKVEKLSQRAFERMINKLDPVYVLAGREGMDAADKKFRPVHEGLDVEAPFERLELDEWNVDVMSLLIRNGVYQKLSPEARARVPRKRLWLSAAIDARTRVIVAMRFMAEHPSEASAVSTLEMAIMPNVDVEESVGAAESFPSGTPEEIAMDSAASYVAKGTQYRILEIGATPVLPPVKVPRLRARIERCFETARDLLVRRFSGQTFSNVVEKGDADPEGDASLTASELNKLMVRGILDVYNNTPHEGLGGETPNDCFKRLSAEYGIPKPPTGEHRRHVFGISDKRRISTEGILVAGVRYQSDAVQQLRREVGQKEVQVRFDRFNMGRISVWYPRHGGWLSVPARVDGLHGVSFWRWREVVQSVQRRFGENSKVRQSVVRQALRDIEGAVTEAEHEAGITPTIVTATDFKRTEREVFRNFSVSDEDDGDGLGIQTGLEDDGDVDDVQAIPDHTDPGRSSADVPPADDHLPEPPDTSRVRSDDDDETPQSETPADDDDDDDDLFGNSDEWTSK